MVIELLNCFHPKLNLKISQTKGLRDPRHGCSLSPSALLRGNVERFAVLRSGVAQREID